MAVEKKQRQFAVGTGAHFVGGKLEMNFVGRRRRRMLKRKRRSLLLLLLPFSL